MNIELSLTEKQFLNEVLDELKLYQINSKDRKYIEQQIVEHFQESREHGEDGINELGDTETFVKDFLDINGIDLHTKIKQIRKTNSRMGISFVIGSFTFIVCYLISQLLLSMFLTGSFNPQNNNSFNYNIFYQISDNFWWNSILMIISFSISSLLCTLVVFYIRRINFSR
ncbi:hypothetical protein ACQKMD_19845 [Viridibacillus sp. NPDC096237]|uniref:hypothetical protein n=1 Tax=Viridibacillus sp. NPDC096237 TaxID=3390721 RepID=UPI003CFBF27E